MSYLVPIISVASVEALLICFFYGYLISRLDRFGSISSRVISLSFLCGMASIPLVIVVQKLLPIHVLVIKNDLVESILDCYIWAGFIEESGKLYIFLFVLYELKQFRLPVHGIILFSLCGLGFAVVENILYMTWITFSTLANKGNLTESIMLGALFRGLPGHILFDAIAGFFLGMAKYKKEMEYSYFWKGWLAAVMLHGTFNFIPDLGSILEERTGDTIYGPVFSFFFLIYIIALIFTTHGVFNLGFKISTREVEYYKMTKGEIEYMHQLRLDKMQDLKRFKKLVPLLSLAVVGFFIFSILLMIFIPGIADIEKLL